MRKNLAARQLEEADRILREMRAGAVLQLQHTRSGLLWTVGDRKIKEPVARFVIASASVAAGHDALLTETLSQTYVWWTEAAR